MTKLFLIRHGETIWNTESRAQGSQNIELNDVGRKQAFQLASRLKKYPIDCIYSSDLIRAYETACIIGKTLNLPITKVDQLREMCFGDWEGLTNDEIKRNYLEYYTIWRNEPHRASIPDGECLVDVQKRTLKAIYEIIHKNKGKSIVVVSHGTAIKAIILGILDIDLSYFYRIRQDNTCINVIEFKEYGPVVVSLNDTAHLENM